MNTMCYHASLNHWCSKGYISTYKFDNITEERRTTRKIIYYMSGGRYTAREYGPIPTYTIWPHLIRRQRPKSKVTKLLFLKVHIDICYFLLNNFRFMEVFNP